MTNPPTISESDLLRRILTRSAALPAEFPQVLVGPGDDCAVVGVGGACLLLKTDQLIEGRHFVSSTPPGLVGRKAVARAVSDIAGCAGTPLAALAAAALPRGCARERAEAIFDAAAGEASRLGCPLVGGDIATHDGAGVMLTVSVVGLPHPVRGPVLRRGGRAGDFVAVTGALGGSFGKDGLGRHLTFEPRVAEGVWLADALGADLHAMMDVSDGLGIDAGRLAAASGASVEILAERLPLAGGATVAGAVGDGEDYELLFCCGVEPARVCAVTGTPITVVGRVAPGRGAWLVLADGSREDISGKGWEHT